MKLKSKDMNTEDHDFRDPQKIREIAEEILKEKNKRIGLISHETETKKLLHELQVHQIELEMQNEELNRAYETSESALKKYTMLYDIAPLGYFTLRKDCTISDLNFTGAEMLGEKRISLINSNFKFFVAEVSLPTFNLFFNSLYSSNSKDVCEVFLDYDGNRLTPVFIEGIVIGDPNECFLSVVDVSRFKR